MKNQIIYVIEADKMVQPNVYTSLKAVCSAFSIPYHVARSKDMQAGNGYTFAIDDKPVTVLVCTLVKQAKGGKSSFGNNFQA